MVIQGCFHKQDVLVWSGLKKKKVIKLRFEICENRDMPPHSLPETMQRSLAINGLSELHLDAGNERKVRNEKTKKDIGEETETVRQTESRQ